MTSFEKSIVINAPQAKVWEKVSDLGAIQDYNPSVKKSYYNTDQKEGVGCGRVCEFHGMGAVDEQAVAWQEGDFYTLRIVPIEKVPFFKQADATFTFTALDSHTTKVHVLMEYEVTAGPIAAVMNKLALKNQFSKSFDGILKGLKRNLEQGAIINTAKDLKGYRAEVVTG